MSLITFMDNLSCLTVVVDKHLGIQMMEFTLLPVVVPSKVKRPIKKPEVYKTMEETVQETIEEKVKMVRPKVKKPEVEESSRRISYTPHETHTLSDEMLLSEFQRITGFSQLFCSHCHTTSPLHEKWLYSIRKRCGKHGISQEMWIPRTCDKSIKVNERCNDINNAAYRMLQKNPHSPAIAESIRIIRRNALQSIGVQAKK